jgi:biotin carboxyl carrier protein
MRSNTKKLTTVYRLLLLAFITLVIPAQELSAQAKRGNKPAANKPAAKKPAANKPSANRSVPKKPDVGNNNSAQRPGANNSGNRNNNNNNSGNRNNNNNSGNKVNIDNSRKNVNVNVDNSKNVHVNNNRNTVVRRNSRPYARPPYVYGGRRYRCYHPYYYHPYRPFVWGPMWHPWGFFVATLATTAIIVSIVDNDIDVPGSFEMASNGGSEWNAFPAAKPLMLSGPAYSSYREESDYANSYAVDKKMLADGDYYFDQGVFYLKENGGYTVVSAPIGAKIKTLPSGYETVSAGDTETKNYYYGGAFYEKRSDGYVVVAPLAGTIVEHISEGGEEVKMGEVTYIKLGETYFQPIQEKGKNMYEVADVEDDK